MPELCPARLVFFRMLVCLLLLSVFALSVAAVSPDSAIAGAEAQPLVPGENATAKSGSQIAASRRYTGKGIMAEPPGNWRVVESKSYVIFVSPDENRMVSAQMLSLDSDDHENFLHSAREIMEAFKGENFRNAGNTASFDLPGVSSMSLARYGDKALLLIIQGQGPELEAVIRSIMPE